MDPKDRKPSDPVDFGPGMKEDGTVNVMTPEEASVARAARDEEDSTFADLLEPDDLSDLDELEEIADAVAK